MTNPAFKAIADQPITLDDLVVPDTLTREYPAVLYGSRLRFLLRERDNNGLVESGTVMQKGRRLLISKTRFLRWLEITD